MRNGVCPKCKTAEVYRAYAPSSLDAGLRTGDGQPLLNVHKDKGGLFGDDFKLLYLEHYVCRNCGFLELYVFEVDKLATLPETKNWQKVERS